ncbi:MAG: BamA/TamA family outer membrane protein [Bacteroidales bacterium]|nr:BamA/TamA family outer membrane protein [Bacteroidales bacterium]
MYNLGTRGKTESKFSTWLREKVGEQPAIYDSASAISSSFEMKQYLSKVGYFNAEVSFSTRRLKKHKVHVDYLVIPSTPYILSIVNYDISDSLIKHFIDLSKTEKKITSGIVYNAFELDRERDRLTAILNNNGYYYFRKDHIFYEIDSTLGNKKMKLDLKIRSLQTPSLSEPWKMEQKEHKQYFIRNVYIRSDYEAITPVSSPSDTLRFTISDRRGIRDPYDYYIIHTSDLKIRPLTIAQSVFIKSGEPYRQIDINRTRSRINELGSYIHANIRFRDVTIADTSKTGTLDCNIELIRRKLHSFTVETEATNSGGRPGIGLNFTYQNNNIFRGAEIFRIKARGALEAQKLFGGDAEYASNLPFFNTIEAGLEATVIFPRFLIPVRQDRFPKYFKPKTTLSLGFGYENRPEYHRWLNNLSFGYDWKESDRKRHQIFPFDWSLINVNLTPEFQQIIDDEPNDRIKYQYSDNFITAIRYTFTYNTQDIRKMQDFFYFRGNLETAGNLLRAGAGIFEAKTDTLGNYVFFGIPFSQYAKIDFDFRFFNIISRNNSVAYRLFMGAGVPYGNASALPLEKGFYAGGSNGMRGWPYRLLGPGSYNDPGNSFDRMGDIQLEANLEYRFAVYRFIKSALFADFGNIWLLKEDNSYQGGEFKFGRFYKEFAIDVGLGVRLDFNFFILRVDFAIPLRDPAQPAGSRWVIDKWQFSDIIINFGIGYPF